MGANHSVKQDVGESDHVLTWGVILLCSYWTMSRDHGPSYRNENDNSTAKFIVVEP